MFDGELALNNNHSLTHPNNFEIKVTVEACLAAGVPSFIINSMISVQPT
jgi:hypothetical protein